jgi:cell division protein FtsQ
MTPTRTAPPARAKRSAAHAAGARRRRTDTASTTPQPAMHPRIRRRRRDIGRQQGRRRLLVVIAAAVLTLLAVGGWLAAHSSLLSAKVVVVTGAVHTPEAAIVDAAGLAKHPPMIDVDPGAAAAAVERLPWVGQAVVTRHWPDGVTVVVHERTPIAVAPVPHSYALVDSTGRVLADGTGAPPPLPVLVVTGMAVPSPGGSLAPAADPLVDVAAKLPVAFKAQVRQVLVAKDGIHLVFTTPVTALIGSDGDLHAKFEDLASILAGATLHNGDVIDVSAPGSPIVTGP